jgi:two-component system, cell cycle response regulator
VQQVASLGLLEAAADQGLKGSLLVIAGAAADIGTHWPVVEEAILGRDPENLLLRDPKISRFHASVTRQGESYALTDMDSTNGTLLNGEPVHGEVPIREGDRIRIGRTVIRFMLVDSTEAACLQQMAHLAGTDPLTGLIAKHRFDSLLGDAFEAAVEAGGTLSVLMLDMDGLKAINTQHGHQLGAHTISQVGALIGRLVGHQGEACRFGGDEFSVMLQDAPLGVAVRVAERIRQTVEETAFVLGELEARPTISIGAAELAPEMSRVGQLVAAADRALYRAKDKGRNCVCD